MQEGTTLRIAVVDDEIVFRQQIVCIINNLYGKDQVSCFLYSDGKELLGSLGKGIEPDAIFLDIEMKELDGMSTAKLIREKYKDIPIVFLTSHTEMAMEGYEVEAFRFLGKPIDETKLRETLSDLERKLKVDEKVVLHKDGEDLIFPVSTLIYIEASNNSVRYVFKNDSVEVRQKFSRACSDIEMLSADFVKIHRSYYVNLGHILKLNSSEVITSTGESLPVARGSGAEVKQRLFEYVRRTGR